MTASPVRIAVTGAAGRMCYSLLPRIARGDLFGPDQPVILQLLEIPDALGVLRGVVMELDDCASPLLAEVTVSDDPHEAFGDAELAILVGAWQRAEGWGRRELFEANAPIFTSQGEALAASASPDIRVVVVGNPVNTNALIAMTNASGVAPERFTGMTRLDHNRARRLLADKAGRAITDVTNVAVWGNHSATSYSDAHRARIGGLAAATVIDDDDWIRNEFISSVRQRGATVMQARGAWSSASPANAIIDHVQDWWFGTAPGDWVSMVIPSDGSYGIPEGLMCSFPVTTAGGDYQIVTDLDLDDTARGLIDISVAELLDERDAALELGLIR